MLTTPPRCLQCGSFMTAADSILGSLVQTCYMCRFLKEEKEKVSEIHLPSGESEGSSTQSRK